MRRIIKYLGIAIVISIIMAIVFYWTSDIPVADLKKEYAKLPSKFIEVQGMPVHYRDEGKPGDPLPIVLIHGTGASLHTWEPMVVALKNDYRVITLDIPAFGLTGPNPKRDYSSEFYTSFIQDFLKAMGVDSCIIGGNSLGGSIAWNYALSYPESVKKLILIDAAGYPTEAKSMPIAFRIAKMPVLKHLLKYLGARSLAAKSVENVYADPSRVRPEVVDRYYNLYLREGNRQALLDRMANTFSPDTYLRINTLQMPTLILWGDEDKLIPVENAYRFQKDLPNDTLVILKNLGHVPMEEDPGTTTDVVRSFLQKH
jgi:pimeloyl-ACP methyl ester carboxylesterase